MKKNKIQNKFFSSSKNKEEKRKEKRYIILLPHYVCIIANI